MTDLLPHERGYAPATDVHGDALSDIRDPAPQGTSVPVVTFRAWDKVTGAEVIVDDRTFDPAVHSLDPVTPAAIHPDTGATRTDGAAALPSPDHPDARLARIADANLDGEYGTLDGSAPDALADGHAGTWSSTTLSTGEEA